MSKRRIVHDGRSRTVYEGTEPGTLIQYFKDDIFAHHGDKKMTAAGKGVLCNRISAHLMAKLETIGVPTAFIRSLNMREQLVRQVEVIPVQLVMRNVAGGSLVQRLGVKEGTILTQPVLEYYYKKDDLRNPWINEQHITTFGWADPYELDEMVHQAYRVNDYLNGLFAGIGLILVDFKLEFGRIYGEYGEIYLMLADEISPDTCRIWDAATGEKLDKDRFRHDLGDVLEGYQKIAERLGLAPKGGIVEDGSVNESLVAGLGDIENELAKHRKLRSLKMQPNKPRKV